MTIDCKLTLHATGLRMSASCAHLSCYCTKPSNRVTITYGRAAIRPRSTCGFIWAQRETMMIETRLSFTTVVHIQNMSSHLPLGKKIHCSHPWVRHQESSAPYFAAYVEPYNVPISSSYSLKVFLRCTVPFPARAIGFCGLVNIIIPFDNRPWMRPLSFASSTEGQILSSNLAASFSELGGCFVSSRSPDRTRPVPKMRAEFTSL